jgi:GntR family transcriptional repressor for pyruvate dehydrogenase complex
MKPVPEEESLFKPIRKQVRSSELLADELCRVIVEGRIRPGENLPSERDLAEKFHVTRNVVREALRSLERLHLLSVRQGSRITVLDYLTSAGFDFVSELFSSSEAGAGKIMDDIAEARRVIGRAMMFFAVDSMKEGFLPEIVEAVEDFCRESHGPNPDMRTLQDLDFEIQNRLMRSTGNQVMLLLHNSIRRIYEKVATLFEPIVSHHRDLADQYRRLAEHLEAGDREQARDVFEAVFEQGRAAMAETR